MKVSQGFDNVEWPATAMKLKLSDRSRRMSSPMAALKRSHGSDPEGLEFAEISFSPNGKFLAALGAPSPAPSHKQAHQVTAPSHTYVKEALVCLPVHSQACAMLCDVTRPSSFRQVVVYELQDRRQSLVPVKVRLLESHAHLLHAHPCCLLMRTLCMRTLALF